MATTQPNHQERQKRTAREAAAREAAAGGSAARAGFADCVPYGDTGVTSGLQRLLNLEIRPDADATRRLLLPWSPYRSLAVYQLWQYNGAAAARPERDNLLRHVFILRWTRRWGRFR